MRILLYLLIGSVFLFGCSQEFDCKDRSVLFSFVGFDSTEIDTIIIKKYEQNSNYLNLLDTLRIIRGQNAGGYSSNDTALITLYLSIDSCNIRPGFDWRLYLPSIDRTISISDMITEKKTRICKRGFYSLDQNDCLCYNKILALKIDNAPVNFPPSESQWEFIYISH
jgi:hypothetical protein